MNKFKVGDRVRILRTSYPKVKELVVGNIATVCKAQRHGIHLYSKEYPRGLFFCFKEVELVNNNQTNNKMTEFKVGDKVKIKAGSQWLKYGGSPNNPIDAVGEITVIGNPDSVATIVKWPAGTNSYEFKDLEQVIEVGDTVEIIDDSGYNRTVARIASRGVVTRISDTLIHAEFTNDGIKTSQVGSKSQLKLVSKANMEVLHYELVTALPSIPVGTKSEKIIAISGTTMYKFAVGDTHNAFSEKQITDTTFFKPVYKPKEVVVDISNSRKVVIKDNLAEIKGVGKLTKTQVQELEKLATLDIVIGGNQVNVNEFQVGCQAFTVKDIKTVFKAFN